MLIADLAMLTGNIGKPGCGVNPLRGQNNVQGMQIWACSLIKALDIWIIPSLRFKSCIPKFYGVQVPSPAGMKNTRYV